jgi:hypothetical protein
MTLSEHHRCVKWNAEVAGVNTRDWQDLCLRDYGSGRQQVARYIVAVVEGYVHTMNYACDAVHTGDVDARNLPGLAEGYHEVVSRLRVIAAE